MLTFFVSYPRDFANEYTVYAIERADAAELTEAIEGLKPITRSEAIRLGWTRPREAARFGEQWFGGFADGGRYPTNARAAIDDAVAGTRLAMLGSVA